MYCPAMFNNVAIPSLLNTLIPIVAIPMWSVTGQSGFPASSDPSYTRVESAYQIYTQRRANLPRRYGNSGPPTVNFATYIAIFAIVFLTTKCIFHITSGSHLRWKRRLAAGGDCGPWMHPGYKTFEMLTEQERSNLEQNLIATIASYNILGNAFSDGIQWRFFYDEYAEVWKGVTKGGIFVTRKYDYRTLEITETATDGTRATRRRIGRMFGIERWMYESPPRHLEVPPTSPAQPEEIPAAASAQSREEQAAGPDQYREEPEAASDV